MARRGRGAGGVRGLGTAWALEPRRPLATTLGGAELSVGLPHLFAPGWGWEGLGEWRPVEAAEVSQGHDLTGKKTTVSRGIANRG